MSLKHGGQKQALFGSNIIPCFQNVQTNQKKVLKTKNVVDQAKERGQT